VKTQTHDKTDWKRATSPWTEPFQRSQDVPAMSEASTADAAPRHAEAPMQQHQQEAEAVDPTRDALSTIFYGN